MTILSLSLSDIPPFLFSASCSSDNFAVVKMSTFFGRTLLVLCPCSSSSHNDQSHVGLTFAFWPIQYLLYCLQRRRADSDTKPAVRHACSQPPPAETVEHFLTVRRQFYFHVDFYTTYYSCQSPVIIEVRGHGQRARRSVPTWGWQTVPGFVYLFFFFFFSSSLTVWAHLTFNDREQGVFVRHKPVWHYPEQQREFMAVFGAAARPWRWQNTCRNDVLMTAAQSPEGNRFRCKIGKKKKGSVSAWDTKRPNLNVFPICF